jgi:hypothetical protein
MVKNNSWFTLPEKQKQVPAIKFNVYNFKKLFHENQSIKN